MHFIHSSIISARDGICKGFLRFLPKFGRGEKPRRRVWIAPLLHKLWETRKGTVGLFWYFVIYSFLGFLLEVAFARATHAAKQDRKCFLLLPLCPVYGLGALGILAAGSVFGGRPLLLALTGGGVATAAELLMGLFYRRVLGVEFWDYAGLPLNVGGQICLPFTLIWTVLALALVYLVHPAVAAVAAHIPDALIPAAAIVLLTDGAATVWLLRTTGTTDCLRWYDGGTR